MRKMVGKMKPFQLFEDENKVINEHYFVARNTPSYKLYPGTPQIRSHYLNRFIKLVCSASFPRNKIISFAFSE